MDFASKNVPQYPIRQITSKKDWHGVKRKRSEVNLTCVEITGRGYRRYPLQDKGRRTSRKRGWGIIGILNGLVGGWVKSRGEKH